MSDKLPENVVRVAVLDWLNSNRSLLGRVVETMVDELVPILADQIRMELLQEGQASPEQRMVAQSVRACGYALACLDPSAPIAIGHSMDLAKIAITELRAAIDAGGAYLSKTTTENQSGSAEPGTAITGEGVRHA
jgi:hypothetical protein